MSDPIRVPASEQTRPGSFLGPDQRAAAWERLGSEQFDVVVIGGGDRAQPDGTDGLAEGMPHGDPTLHRGDRRQRQQAGAVAGGVDVGHRRA